MLRKINLKKRGFILYEAILIIFIFLTILFTGILKTKNIKENQDMKEAIIKISETIDYYSMRSLKKNERYNIEIDYIEKEIKILDNKELIEKIILPTKLTYTTPYTFGNIEKLLNTITLTTTEGGNLSNSLTIYILDYSKNIKYRLATYTFQQNKILKINIYQKINGEEVNLEELNEYHNLLYEEEKFSSHWKKI